MHCSMAKVIVKPKKGRAILWYNHFINPDTEWTGSVDRNSLHGGCVVHQGVKWIANNWINAGNYLNLINKIPYYKDIVNF